MRNLPYCTRRLQDIKQKVSVRNQYLSGNVRSSSIRGKFELVLFLGDLAMYPLVVSIGGFGIIDKMYCRLFLRGSISRTRFISQVAVELTALSHQ